LREFMVLQSMFLPPPTRWVFPPSLVLFQFPPTRGVRWLFLINKQTFVLGYDRSIFLILTRHFLSLVLQTLLFSDFFHTLESLILRKPSPLSRQRVFCSLSKDSLLGHPSACFPFDFPEYRGLFKWLPPFLWFLGLFCPYLFLKFTVSVPESST